MIQLRDSILIDVPPNRIWDWLKDLPAHYREWHPAHVSCSYERGDSLAVGTVVYVEEYLHGRLHRLHLKATQVVPGRVLRYRGPGLAGAFVIEPAVGATRFTAELFLGTQIPVISRLLDALLRSVLGHRLAELQQHMREEGANLKRLLERDRAT